MTKANFHERLEQRDEELITGSNRRFGLLMGAVLVLIATVALYKGAVLRAGAFGIPGMVLLAAAMLCASRLTWLNRLWMRFGLLLHRVTSPVVMLLLFAFSIVPVGLLMRLSAADPLRRRFEPGAKSYWIERPPQALSLPLLRRQF